MHEAAITWLDGGHIEHAPASAFRKELDVTANEENGLDISITFPHEGEYRIRIEGENADGDTIPRMSPQLTVPTAMIFLP